MVSYLSFLKFLLRVVKAFKEVALYDFKFYPQQHADFHHFTSLLFWILEVMLL